MNTNEVYKFEFERTAEQFSLFVGYVSSEYRPFWYGAALFAVAVVLPSFLGTFLFSSHFGVLFGASVALLTYALLSNVQFFSPLSPNGIYLGPVMVQIDGRGLNFEHAKYESKMKWEAVIDVKEEPGFVFLFMDKLDGVLLPSEVFLNAEQKDEFVRFCRSHLCY